MNEDCTLVFSREGDGEVMVTIRDGEVAKVAVRPSGAPVWGGPMQLVRKEERR